MIIGENINVLHFFKQIERYYLRIPIVNIQLYVGLRDIQRKKPKYLIAS